MDDKVVTSIVIVNLPKNLTYFLGGKGIDPAGGQICAIYDDGTYDMLRMDQEGVELSYNSQEEGQALATVSYKGKSQMFQVFVRKPVIRKFLMAEPPEKKNYLAGEKLDLTGMKLVAEYETGEKVPYTDIPEVDHTVQYGEAVYPLLINGISIPIYIKVADATLVGIKMGKLPTKTEYLERKDKFNPAGGTIIQMFNSGTEQEVPISYSSVKGFSNLVPGPLTLTVQVGQFSTQFDVKIIEKTPIKVTIDTPPFRTTYTEGEQIIMDGARISVAYDNGEARICDNWDYEPKTATLGQELVLVHVGEATATFAISVAPRQLMSIRVCKLPNKMQYKERLEQLDITGAELELNYDYGDPVKVPIENYMVKGFDNRRAGECRVEVQYQGLITEFTVDILPQTLLGIMITQMPEKVDYAPGESFDKKGLVVSGFYDSGAIEPLRSYAISPDRPLKAGDVAILITSMDKTAVVPIKVSEMFRPKISDPQPWETIEKGEPISTPDTFEFDRSPAYPAQGTDPFGSYQQKPPAGGQVGFIPYEDPSALFGRSSQQEEPQGSAHDEPEKKKGRGFWGKKLFPPNTSKYRGND